MTVLDRQDPCASGKLAPGSGRGRVGGLESLPEDVDLAFVAGDALADADGELTEIGRAHV